MLAPHLLHAGLELDGKLHDQQALRVLCSAHVEDGQLRRRLYSPGHIPAQMISVDAGAWFIVVNDVYVKSQSMGNSVNVSEQRSMNCSETTDLWHMRRKSLL